MKTKQTLPIDALVFDLNGTLWFDVPTGPYSPGVHPDAEEVFAELKSSYSLFVVSNCHPYQMEEFLKTFQNNPWTETVHFGKYGPTKEKNLAALKSIHRFQNPLYLGDSPSDQKAAERAGYKFVWAGYAFENFEKPSGEILHTLKELPEYLKTL